MKNQFNPSEVPASLAKAHASGKPIVLASRLYRDCAWECAVNDALEAAKFLAERGIDIRASIPVGIRLVAQLKQASTVQFERADGRTSTTRVLRFDLRATHGVILVISCSVGSWTYDDEIHSYADYLAELVKESGAVALFVPRIDRMVRQASGLGPVMDALARCGGFLVDPVNGFTRAGSAESFLASVGAQHDGGCASRQSERIVRGIRDAKERRARALSAE